MDKANVGNVKLEINAILAKPLTPSSVDLLYKLTTIEKNLAEYRHDAHIVKSSKENEKCNGKLDRDINSLFFAYRDARKGNDECIMLDSLSELLGEISDLIIEIYNTAKCESERFMIDRALEKIKMH